MPSRSTVKNHSRPSSRARSRPSSRPISIIEKAIVVLLAVQNLQGNDPNLNLNQLGQYREGESEHLDRIIKELAEKYDRSYSENIPPATSFSSASNRPTSRFQKTLRRFRKIAARVTGMRGTFSGRGNVPVLNQ
jgi:hypothetical protein